MSKISFKCVCGEFVKSIGRHKLQNEKMKKFEDAYQCPKCKRLLIRIFDARTENYEFYYEDELK